jgi:DNA-binding CsgD family transcriptional regulator
MGAGARVGAGIPSPREAPDLVDVVEALYSPGLSWDEWLSLVAEKIRPLTDRYNVGVGGMLYTCPDPCAFIPTRMLMTGVPDSIVASFSRGIQSMPPAYVADQFMLGTFVASDCRGWREMAPVKDGSYLKDGFIDGVIVAVLEPDGAGCWFGSPQSAHAPLSEELHLALTRIRTHLAAAHRLRRKHSNGSVSPDSAEAVIDADGRVQHADSAARDDAARAALSRATRQMTKVRQSAPGSDSRENIHEWESLVFDRWTLADHVDTDGKLLTLAVDNRPAPPSLELLSERELQVVLWAAAGHANKVIAYELGVSHSTVRVLLARAATKIGVRTRVELLEKVARLRSVTDARTKGRAPGRKGV